MNRNLINTLKKLFAMALILCPLFFFLFWNNLDSSYQEITKLHVTNKICEVNLKDDRPYFSETMNNTDSKTIYFVTPTYPRPEQAPELTRLSHTLMHVPQLHWIVADDQPHCSDHVSKILRKSGLPFTHISSPKPYAYNKGKNYPRGVANRRAALHWLHNNAHRGILYFGDDDNTVDLELFNEIRSTKKVSMFPVGLIGEFGVSSPVVKNGKVVGFYDSWPGSRTFAVDMAGFAVNLEYLKPSASMPYHVGQEEDKFLVSLGLKLEDIEPLANNCSKVLVWHTKTKKYNKAIVKLNLDHINQLKTYESFAKLLKETSDLNMAQIDTGKGTKGIVTKDRKTISIEHLSDLD